MTPRIPSFAACQNKCSDEVKAFIAGDGVLECVVATLASPSPTVRVYGVSLLSQMAEDKQCRRLLGQQHTIEPVVALLARGAGDDDAVQTATAVWAGAEAKVSAGGKTEPSNLRDVSPDEAFAVGLAVRTLAFLSINVTNAIRCVEFGALLPLVRVCGSAPAFSVQFLAAFALASIAENASSQSTAARIEQVELLPRLLALARAWGVAIIDKDAAADLIAGGATSTQAGTLQATTATFPPLMALAALTSSASHEIRVWAAWGLAALSHLGTCPLLLSSCVVCRCLA